MKPFTTLLKETVRAHGHLCPGLVVGVRMAMLGCRLIGIDDPTRHDQIKKLIVFVEMDRCTADAVAQVTGVKLGRRSLKHMDYGIMAATFLNLETGRAMRVISTEESRDLARMYAPAEGNKRAQQLAAYVRMPEPVLFRVQEVRVRLNDYDLPGPTRGKTACSSCGQIIRDHREIVKNGRILCRPCMDDAYFYAPREVTWQAVDVNPGQNQFNTDINTFSHVAGATRSKGEALRHGQTL